MQGLKAAHACDQGVDRHAEGHDADPKTHAEEEEEVQVFKDYFQVQASPSNCVAHCVQNLFMLHGVAMQSDAMAGQAGKTGAHTWTPKCKDMRK